MATSDNGRFAGPRITAAHERRRPITMDATGKARVDAMWAGLGLG